MMTFSEYVRWREGLWLNDKNALPGMSRLNALAARPKTKKTAPDVLKPIKPVAKIPKLMN